MPNPKETAARRPPERTRPDEGDDAVTRFFETVGRLERAARETRKDRR